jgi:hypothetical protein
MDHIPSSNMGANNCQEWHMPGQTFNPTEVPAAAIRLATVTLSCRSIYQEPT